MKEKKLYKCIVNSLFNIFANDKLKGRIILTEEFKKIIVKQIANLLTLEKKYECEWENRKYASIFAQILANVTGESEIIEKDDNASFSTLDEEYVHFLKFVSENCKVTKESLTEDYKTSSIDEVELLSDFVDKDATLLALKKEKEEENISQKVEFENEINNNQSGPTQQTINSGMNAGGFGAFGANSFGYGFPGMMPQGANLATHPKFDERFYPYDRKPKYIFLLKQIFAWLSIIIAALVIIFILVTNFMKIDFGSNILFYKDSKEYYIWGDNNSSSPPSGCTSGLSLALVNLFRLSFIWVILIVLIVSYLAYSILAPKKLKQEKYLISRFNLGFVVIIYIVIIGMLLSSIFPSFIENFVNSISITKSGQVASINPANNINDVIAEVKNIIVSNSSYKISLSLAIVIVIISILTSVLGIIIFIIAPKLDRNKLILAETEYQKMIAAAMKGQKYEPSSSLFDEEFRRDNSENNDNDENKS